MFQENNKCQSSDCRTVRKELALTNIELLIRDLEVGDLYLEDLDPEVVKKILVYLETEE